MNQKILKLLLKQYNINPIKIYSVQSGYRNHNFHIIDQDGNHKNLIIYKNESNILKRIKSANEISDYLYSKNFPTRKSLGEILEIKTKKQIRYACLYNYLEGETIPWEAYTMKHLKLLGMAMGMMHSQFQAIKLRNSKDIVDELILSIEKMKRYFSTDGVISALKLKLNLTSNNKVIESFQEIIKRNDAENAQYVHMDFVRSNILFSKEETKNSIQFENDNLYISGILDFEKSGKGPYIFDVARTLAFLIIDCKYKSKLKVEKYFLESGYYKRGKAKELNKSELYKLVGYFLIYDFYKFLRHNPYEYLQANEHFVRTKNYLLQHNLIYLRL